MARLVAFLRGINVGGHRLRMETLRDALVELGLANVRTFIASGNVTFDAARAAPAALERRIETQLAATLGYQVPTFVRSTVEVREVVEHEAFPPDEIAAAHALHVIFLREPLAEDVSRATVALATPVDVFCPHGRQIYWLCRSRLSESQVPASAFARVLGKQATTMRNMTMLKKLVATM